MAYQKEWLTGAEVIREYQIKERTFYLHRQLGYIKYKLRRNRPVYSRKEIERYLSPASR